VITGASGLLGAHVAAALSRSYEVIGVDRHAWWGDEPVKMLVGDLEDPHFLQRAVASMAPDVLIHCAALAHVDQCEQDPAQAYASNATLTHRLVGAVSSRCLVVYISSDGVFRGNKPWATEQDLPCPRTVYGRSKVHGEWSVAQATDNHLIVRTNFYGWSSGRKTTFGEWLSHALEIEEPVTLFTDFYFTPIYVVDLVERVARLLETDYRGIIHVGGRDRLSKYEFGRLMADAGHFRMDHIRPGSIDEVPVMARRPKDMSLSSQRFVQSTGLEVPAGMSGLRRFIADRGRSLSARLTASETPMASSPSVE